MFLSFETWLLFNCLSLNNKKALEKTEGPIKNGQSRDNVTMW
jgi:hypothetical protein